MTKQLLAVGVTLLAMSQIAVAQNETTWKGTIETESGSPISSAVITINQKQISILSDAKGNFVIPDGITAPFQVTISKQGFVRQTIDWTAQQKHLHVVLIPYDKILDPVEVFGRPNHLPDKLDALTALPLKANEQIQSVSVLSNRLIRLQDIQDISEALRNVPGVIEFSNFGGIGNSYTIRGIRGINTLMNGIQLDNDFRGHGVQPDMETVDNIQVLKGIYSMSQGLSNSLGAVGGVVNAVTKTPNFINAGSVGLRYSSWSNIRGVYDIQKVVSNKFAYRLDGAMQAGNGYRKYTKNDRFVINPSIKWIIDDKTTLTGEYHYQHDSRTPDRGTINLASDSVNGLWNMPNSKFLGFESDHNITNTNFWGLRLVRNLNKNLDLKINYYGSTFKQDFNSSIADLDSSAFKATGDRNVRYRYMNHVTEDDKSSVVNVALVGHDIFTGSIHHTFQIGYDYRRRDWYSQAFNSKPIDTIDIYQNYTNVLSNQNLTYTENKGRYYNRNYTDYGLYAQDMLTFNKYVRALLGLRYSNTASVDNKSNTYASGHGINPLLGLFISPIEQLNFFGSYTSVSDISTAEYVDENGKKLGNTVTNQYEFGLKSNYFHDRLRFNFTYFIMNNDDYTYQLTNLATGNVYYNQSGSLKRHGIETELTGHILNNLEVLLGYTHVEAKFQDVKSYVDGSTPMGTAKNTANGWLNYLVDRGAIKGLSVGVGVYYVGSRPVDDFSKSTNVSVTTGGGEVQKITPGVKPFMLDAYTTVNAQLSYNYKQYTFRAVMNNIGNSKGYIAYYPQAFLNPTDPRNFGLSIYYAF